MDQTSLPSTLLITQTASQRTFRNFPETSSSLSYIQIITDKYFSIKGSVIFQQINFVVPYGKSEYNFAILGLDQQTSISLINCQMSNEVGISEIHHYLIMHQFGSLLIDGLTIDNISSNVSALFNEIVIGTINIINSHFQNFTRSFFESEPNIGGVIRAYIKSELAEFFIQNTSFINCIQEGKFYGGAMSIHVSNQGQVLLSNVDPLSVFGIDKDINFALILTNTLLDNDIQITIPSKYSDYITIQSDGYISDQNEYTKQQIITSSKTDTFFSIIDSGHLELYGLLFDNLKPQSSNPLISISTDDNSQIPTLSIIDCKFSQDLNSYPDTSISHTIIQVNGGILKLIGTQIQNYQLSNQKKQPGDGNGAAINADIKLGSKLIIKDSCQFYKCISNNGNGGAIYVDIDFASQFEFIINDATIQGCQVKAKATLDYPTGYGGGIFLTGSGEYDPSTQSIDLKGMKIYNNVADNGGQSLYVAMTQIAEWCKYGIFGEYIKGNYSDQKSDFNELQGISVDRDSFNKLSSEQIIQDQLFLQYQWRILAILTNARIILNVTIEQQPLRFVIEGSKMIQGYLLAIQQYNSDDLIYPSNESYQPIALTGDPQDFQTATFGMKDYSWFDYKKKEYNMLISNDRRFFTGIDRQEGEDLLMQVEIEQDFKSQFPVWAIVAIIIGSLVVIAVLIIVISIIVYRQKVNKRRKTSDSRQTGSFSRQQPVQLVGQQHVQLDNPQPDQLDIPQPGSLHTPLPIQQHSPLIETPVGHQPEIVAIQQHDQQPVYTSSDNNIQEPSSSFLINDLIGQNSQIGQYSPGPQQTPPNNINPLPNNINIINIHTFNTNWVLANFAIIGELGKGGYGVVYHAIEISSNRHVALKKMKYGTDKEKLNANKEKDMMVLSYQSHHQNGSQSHIVEPLGFFVDNNSAYLVIEYFKNGDLRKYINSMRSMGAEINDDKALKIIYQLSDAVYQIHLINIIHGDIKPENILLTQDYKVKLTDFGLAKQMPDGRSYLTVQGGTFTFQAPELLTGSKQQGDNRVVQRSSADIWAIGISMFELLAQRHPFFTNDEGNPSTKELIRRITEDAPAKLPDHYSINLKDLIRDMLEKDSSRRITAEKILEKPEVAQFRANN
ncbi:MAG: putative AUR protein kinase [Streblomastix strix]|uniref:non-specific serine/threonine protein kinase n=1 Tax=Streblomastix strix TaxID=222440 RepID=A0A5J4VXZ9_9EUKA|nr:MAG: putative AUR protein kinase [Streblomastix strix]